jgi:hypothetical protein
VRARGAVTQPPVKAQRCVEHYISLRVTLCTLRSTQSYSKQTLVYESSLPPPKPHTHTSIKACVSTPREVAGARPNCSVKAFRDGRDRNRRWAFAPRRSPSQGGHNCSMKSSCAPGRTRYGRRHKQHAVHTVSHSGFWPAIFFWFIFLRHAGGWLVPLALQLRFAALFACRMGARAAKAMACLARRRNLNLRCKKRQTSGRREARR